MTESGLPVYGEIPICSDVRVYIWRVVTPTFESLRWPTIITAKILKTTQKLSSTRPASIKARVFGNIAAKVLKAEVNSTEEVNFTAEIGSDGRVLTYIDFGNVRLS